MPRKPKPKQLDISQTALSTWFERDRAHVRLSNTKTDKTLIEWWDEDVSQAVEDGFLSDKGFILGRLVRTRELHESAYEYARYIGIIA